MYKFKSYSTNLYSLGAMGLTDCVYILVLYVSDEKTIPLFHAFSQEEVDEFVAEFMR